MSDFNKIATLAHAEEVIKSYRACGGCLQLGEPDSANDTLSQAVGRLFEQRIGSNPNVSRPFEIISGPAALKFYGLRMPPIDTETVVAVDGDGWYVNEDEVIRQLTTTVEYPDGYVIERTVGSNGGSRNLALRGDRGNALVVVEARVVTPRNQATRKIVGTQALCMTRPPAVLARSIRRAGKSWQGLGPDRSW